MTRASGNCSGRLWVLFGFGALQRKVPFGLAESRVVEAENMRRFLLTGGFSVSLAVPVQAVPPWDPLLYYG